MGTRSDQRVESARAAPGATLERRSAPGRKEGSAGPGLFAQLPGAIGNAAFAGLVKRASASGALARERRREAGAGRAFGIFRQDTQPDAAPAEAETYTLTLSDGTHPNLGKAQAIGLLVEAKASLQRAIDLDSGEYALVNQSRTTFFGAIGGALTDLAGKEFPGYDETWGEAYNQLIKAQHELRAQNVQGASQALIAANAAYDKGKVKWYEYKAQLSDAGTRAQIGVAVVAVVAVAVIATGGAVAAAAAPAAGGTAAAGAGGTAVVGGGAGGAAALAATAPVDAAALGGATTVAAGGGGAAAAGGGGAAALAATVPVDAAAAGTATTVAAGGGGAAAAGGGAGAAVGTTTVAGVSSATGAAMAESATGELVGTMLSEGPTAATTLAESLSPGMLDAVFGRLTVVLVANAPFTTRELQLMSQLQQILIDIMKRQEGITGLP